MEAVDRNLVKIDRGMILLLAPPFNNSYLEPGYIKGYVPGVRENGGQYTHAAVWVILALNKLGLGDKAVKYYEMISPTNHTKTELDCMTYKLEPYVMAAVSYTHLDVYKRQAYRTSPTNMGMGIISEVAAYDLGYITIGEFIDKIDLILKNMNDLKREHGHFYNWYDTRTKEPIWRCV